MIEMWNNKMDLYSDRMEVFFTAMYGKPGKLFDDGGL